MASLQMHLGLILDDKLNFKEHIEKKFCRAMKGISILRKLYHLIPRSAFLTIYSTFFQCYISLSTENLRKPRVFDVLRGYRNPPCWILLAVFKNCTQTMTNYVQFESTLKFLIM